MVGSGKGNCHARHPRCQASYAGVVYSPENLRVFFPSAILGAFFFYPRQLTGIERRRCRLNIYRFQPMARSDGIGWTLSSDPYML